MQLLKVILTGEHVHDSEPTISLFSGIELGAFACIPDKANFKIKHDFDLELYKQRNIVERFF